MAGNSGEQYAAQLARVTERRPRVTSIRNAGQQLQLVVKIRPRLVHYIVNGVVMVRCLLCPSIALWIQSDERTDHPVVYVLCIMFLYVNASSA